jgi:SAM-dependent methyltransferase
VGIHQQGGRAPVLSRVRADDGGDPWLMSSGNSGRRWRSATTGSSICRSDRRRARSCETAWPRKSGSAGWPSSAAGPASTPGYSPARRTQVVATDLSPGMLALAKDRVDAPNVAFQTEDAQKTSFPDAAFDTAFMSLVIHFTDPARTVAEMHRILKPGGAAHRRQPRSWRPRRAGSCRLLDPDHLPRAHRLSREAAEGIRKERADSRAARPPPDGGRVSRQQHRADQGHIPHVVHPDRLHQGREALAARKAPTAISSNRLASVCSRSAAWRSSTTPPTRRDL